MEPRAHTVLMGCGVALLLDRLRALAHPLESRDISLARASEVKSIG
jgi:hypothetical protein